MDFKMQNFFAVLKWNDVFQSTEKKKQKPKKTTTTSNMTEK